MSDSSPVPGWYPDVERPGGERWWDGRSWTEYRREAAGQPGVAPQVSQPPPTNPYGESGQPGGSTSGPAWGQQPAPTGYQPYGSVQQWPSSSKAGWALGLSIFGLFCCGLSAIAGVILGRQEMTAIDEGRANPANRGLAKAAFIVGIVALSLAALWIVLSLSSSAFAP